MGTIFLSYRRLDSATVSGHIYDHLVRIFGENTVFKDVFAIPPGVNFAEYIDAQIRKCSVLLAVIGPEWLTAADEHGAKRLDDPSKFSATGDRIGAETEGSCHSTPGKRRHHTSRTAASTFDAEPFPAKRATSP